MEPQLQEPPFRVHDGYNMARVPRLIEATIGKSEWVAARTFNDLLFLASLQ